MKQTDAVEPPKSRNKERHGWLPAVGILNREIRPVPRACEGCCHESIRYTLNNAIDQIRSRGPAFAGDPDRSAGSEAHRDEACPSTASGRPLAKSAAVSSTPKTAAPATSPHRGLRPFSLGATARCLHAGLVGPSSSGLGLFDCGSDRARPPLRRQQPSARPVQTVGGHPRRFARSGRNLDRTGGFVSGHRHRDSRGFPWLYFARRQPRGLHA